MTATRRDFLLGCSAAIAAYAGSRISYASFADDAAPLVGPPMPRDNANDTLVIVFLRGGIDGLQLLAPVDDEHYVAARSENLRVTDRGERAGLALKHDFAKQDFRLHHAAAPLKELYDSGTLAFIHACGITSGTRSHFEAMDLIERGAGRPGSKEGSTGWISRHLMSMQARGAELGDAPAFAAMDGLPAAMLGFERAMSGKEAKSMGLWYGEAHMQALRAMYVPGMPFHSQASTALRAIEAIAKHLPKDKKGEVMKYKPSADAKYPGGDFSTGLQTLAQLIKLQVGLKVACVDFGGWDMHQSQSYFFPVRTGELAKNLHAFVTDIREHLGTTSVVVMSEFGRRLKANKSEGTDHGHGTVMMALGGNVHGGRIYGKWPGLATEQLDSGADLAVTTDHRMVLGELLLKRAGNAKLGEVFPGLQAFSPLGVFAGQSQEAILGA
jgi:uncharacterized protein (DUF1501 family)